MTTASETPTKTADESTSSGSYRRVEISMHETTARAIARAVLRGSKHLAEFEKNLIAETVDAGTVSYTSINYLPLSDRLYVHPDTAYFRLTRSIVARTSVTAHAFQIDAISPCPDEDSGQEPTPFDELSDTDQQVFLVGVRDNYDRNYCFSFSDRLVQYSSEQKTESIFINESPTLVQYENETYRVEYEGTEERTAKTFEFTAERLGSTFEEYKREVVPEVVWHVTPSELPEPQREFFERLRDELRYEKENPIPDRVFNFIDRVRAHAYALRGTGPYFIEHEDTYYRLTYTHAVA